DLDLADAFHTHRLDADVLRCLRYMHDIELHTVCYLRDLLVTSAHRDPEITTFLTFWSYEEYWHGEAIATVLRAHDEPAGAARVRQLRRTRLATPCGCSGAARRKNPSRSSTGWRRWRSARR